MNMDFATSVRTCLSKYVTFSGRASRPEFWWFMLFCLLISIAAAIIDAMLFGDFTRDVTGPIGAVVSLGVLLPTVSVTVRRLHDTGRSGWWYWLFLIPVIGTIILIVWLATRGEAGQNAYGPRA
ncbi:DUF805 domain-containing protein [Paracoccaceae bacterium Fryx2]|nr:DUF805 domain-containing protein [Paracoccaceae bacterium Fryx2]